MSNNSFTVDCVLDATGIFFLSRCLVMAVSLGSTVLGFKLHVTLHSEVVRGHTDTHTHRRRDALKVGRGSVFSASALHSVSE